MILLFIQITVVAAVALYLSSWRNRVRRLNAQSWESLMAQLRPD